MAFCACLPSIETRILQSSPTFDSAERFGTTRIEFHSAAFVSIAAHLHERLRQHRYAADRM